MTAIDMKDNLSMIGEMARVNISGRMAESMMDLGKMESNMVKECTLKMEWKK